MSKIQNVLIVAGLIQLAYGQCPYAYSSDGYIYDLTDISSRIHLAVRWTHGLNYVFFNISICNPSPYDCGGSCGAPFSAGICEYWIQGPPPNANCYGQYANSKVIGLHGGSGVQITYFGGDSGRFRAGTLTSIVTLTCITSPGIDPYHIKWTSVDKESGSEMSPVVYFNGTISCKTYYSPIASKPTYAQ